MDVRTRTAVVGAGQAGLALSRLLTEQGRDHLLIERGRVAERWRSERWDSFKLLTPNWQTRLPGVRYAGPEPDGFLRRDEIVRFLTGYARSFDAPVLTGVNVTRLTRDGEAWRVVTSRGTVVADEVVVATGHHARPFVPSLATALPPGIRQLHSARYRRPEQLDDGGVLVVGAGPSGQQLARELNRAGRRVHLAVGRHRQLPRDYRGRDSHAWLEDLGALDRTVDTLPDPAAARRAPSVVLSGDGDLSVRSLVTEGVVAVGRLTGVDRTRLRFDAGLGRRLAEAEGNELRFRLAVDDHVRRNGLDAPEDGPHPFGLPGWAATSPAQLDLEAAGVRTVLWATGFRRSFDWLPAEVLDEDGEIVHRRGVTSLPGLYVLGLRWLYRRSSNTIDGVGADAAHLAEHIARRRAGRPEAA